MSVQVVDVRHRHILRGLSDLTFTTTPLLRCNPLTTKLMSVSTRNGRKCARAEGEDEVMAAQSVTLAYAGVRGPTSI